MHCVFMVELSSLSSLKIISAFIIVFTGSITLILIYQDAKLVPIKPPRPKMPGLKTILYWHPLFKREDHYLGLGKQMFYNCEFNKCITTADRNYQKVDEFDAIVFHGADYEKEVHGEPQQRRPNQIYIFGDLESPLHMFFSVRRYNNYYNWTMTYRPESDVFRPYGRVEEKQTNYTPPTPEEIQGRPKKIAWFASRCESWSYRENLVKAISKHIPVDVYGNCGKLKCPRSTTDECYDKLETDYKFYLSFENSFCQDYVTEKLFLLLQLNVIPIVYGATNYTKVAPPHSVIDVKQFESIEDLVALLKFLDENPKEYLRYFDWKKRYVSRADFKQTICDLCRKLHEPIEPKTYDDIGDWWEGSESKKKCSNSFIKKFLRLDRVDNDNG